ncbi:MAG: hypothetical protein H7263_13635 [Candidatus Sericytochromatia bacterium]|nr:hypothetical protein [Candidatus Sericytochromatia bacterium]
MDDKRVEQNKANLMKLREFLLEVCTNYTNYLNNELVINALGSQGNLAKYEDKELGIQISSLNTLKRTSEKLFDNGFNEIDKLRLLALEKLTNSTDSSVGRNTKEYYQERAKKLESELEQQKQVNVVAISELMNNLQLLKNIQNIKELNLVHSLCSKHVARLQSYALNFTEFAPLKKESHLKVIKGTKE